MEMRTGVGGVRPRSRPSQVQGRGSGPESGFPGSLCCNQNCSKYPQGVGLHFPDLKPRLSREAKPQKDVWSSKAEGEAREEAAQQAERNGGGCPRPTEPAPLACEARSGPLPLRKQQSWQVSGEICPELWCGLQAPKGGKMQFWEEGQGSGNSVKRRIP